MTYVLAGYGITALAIGGYAAWVLARGRRLTRNR
jgi:heme exporter protein CcmD